ncbi:hypothetical protein [Geodermatophilus obscurus]|nr:hypothetical protein [Geodermatophilus obscurus]
MPPGCRLTRTGEAAAPRLAPGRRAADLPGMALTTFATTTFAAARSRAHGPTAALWHAVEVHRLPAEVDGACELTLCGTLARVALDEPWPSSSREVCGTCTTLAGVTPA